MEHTRKFDCPRDEFKAAAYRERELNDALSYLDWAISQFATQEAPSRWVESQRQPVRRGAFTPKLIRAVQRLARFGTAQRSVARPTAAISR